MERYIPLNNFDYIMQQRDLKENREVRKQELNENAKTKFPKLLGYK